MSKYELNHYFATEALNCANGFWSLEIDKNDSLLVQSVEDGLVFVVLTQNGEIHWKNCFSEFPQLDQEPLSIECVGLDGFLDDCSIVLVLLLKRLYRENLRFLLTAVRIDLSKEELNQSGLSKLFSEVSYFEFKKVYNPRNPFAPCNMKHIIQCRNGEDLHLIILTSSVSSGVVAYVYDRNSKTLLSKDPLRSLTNEVKNCPPSTSSFDYLELVHDVKKCYFSTSSSSSSSPYSSQPNVFSSDIPTLPHPSLTSLLTPLLSPSAHQQPLVHSQLSHPSPTHSLNDHVSSLCDIQRVWAFGSMNGLLTVVVSKCSLHVKDAIFISHEYDPYDKDDVKQLDALFKGEREIVTLTYKFFCPISDLCIRRRENCHSCESTQLPKKFNSPHSLPVTGSHTHSNYPILDVLVSTFSKNILVFEDVLHNGLSELVTFDAFNAVCLPNVMTCTGYNQLIVGDSDHWVHFYCVQSVCHSLTHSSHVRSDGCSIEIKKTESESESESYSVTMVSDLSVELVESVRVNAPVMGVRMIQTENDVLPLYVVSTTLGIYVFNVSMTFIKHYTSSSYS